jgi:hypothetical protein
MAYKDIYIFLAKDRFDAGGCIYGSLAFLHSGTWHTRKAINASMSKVLIVRA